MWIVTLFLICLIFAFLIENFPSAFGKEDEDSNYKNYLVIICLVLLSLVSGTRMVGGTDFYAYQTIYRVTPTFPVAFNPANWGLTYEIGYIYICAFFKTLGISFYGFCLIHSFFFYFCLWKGISKFTRHWGIVILVFLYKLFFYNTFISMRQSITVAVFFLMVSMIAERKWVQYYLCAFFASLIHNGALLLFLLYPLTYLNITKERFFLLTAIFTPTILVGLFGIDIFSPIISLLTDFSASGTMDKKVEGYAGNMMNSALGVFHTLEYYLILIVFYFNYDRIELDSHKKQIVVWMFLCILPLFTLFRSSEILTREKDYFTIFYAVIIGYMIDSNENRRLLMYLATFAVCAFGYYRFVLLFDGGDMLNYESWLFNPKYSFFLK